MRALTATVAVEVDVAGVACAEPDTIPKELYALCEEEESTCCGITERGPPSLWDECCCAGFNWRNFPSGVSGKG